MTAWDIVIGVGGAVIGAFGNWGVNQAKKKNLELDNVEKAIEIWKSLAEGLQKDLESLKLENYKLQNRMTDLIKSNEKLSEKIKQLENEIEYLNKK